MFHITQMALALASNKEMQEAIEKSKRKEMNQEDFDELREKVKKQIKEEKGWD